MSSLKIAWRNMQQRALASALTGVSMALGVALVITVLVVYGVIDTYFRGAAEGYNIIVGAKGSKLQLVMNTVYHLDAPIENIPWSFYNEFRVVDGKPGRWAGIVDVAIPYCLGDNYQGYRVVGTTSELFTRMGFGIDPDGQVREYKFREGRCFADTGEGYFEGVIGSVVASRTGLKVGDIFAPTHGVSDDPRAQGVAHIHNPFKVVGVLAPTGTPNDRAVFINLEGFFLIEGHAKPLEEAEARAAGQGPAARDQAGDRAAAGADRAAGDRPTSRYVPLPDEKREVTAILLRTNSPIAGITLPRRINKGNVAQAVFPIREIHNLLDKYIGPIRLMLLSLAVLIVVVAGIGTLVSIYNSMSERRRDIAIMRSLGASRGRIMFIVLLESALLSLLGGIGGVVLGHGLIVLLNHLFLTRLTGITIPFGRTAWFDWDVWGQPISFPWGVWDGTLSLPWEAALVPGLIVLAGLVGIIPALAAYRTDVAKALSAAP